MKALKGRSSFLVLQENLTEFYHDNYVIVKHFGEHTCTAIEDMLMRLAKNTIVVILVTPEVAQYIIGDPCVKPCVLQHKVRLDAISGGMKMEEILEDAAALVDTFCRHHIKK